MNAAVMPAKDPAANRLNGGRGLKEKQVNLRWLEIVSWRTRPGPLIARVRASTPGSQRCKFSDLVPSEILQNL